MAGQDGNPKGASGDEGLVPEDPSDVGLEPVEVDIVDVEPMHELANEARDELRRLGFDDNEIDDWAREYVAHEGPGDVDEFIAWVKVQERAGTRERGSQ
jgi:hypothetical protein